MFIGVTPASYGREAEGPEPRRLSRHDDTSVQPLETDRGSTPTAVQRAKRPERSPTAACTRITAPRPHMGRTYDPEVSSPKPKASGPIAARAIPAAEASADTDAACSG